MNIVSMTNMHQTAQPWQWALPPRTATRIAAGSQPRWLRVVEGRVWLTQSGAGEHSAQDRGGDLWLAAGQRHCLPPGAEWVAEGWPQARIEVLEAPLITA
ncbi:DUF2917 domain-containing protein [Hylemonella sp. W303a]|uniref:DUF2917 domain-containing protein n=1 Tax=Hylemonella sp. W303a TaxID=3389873 RepID=UPI00396AFBDE